MGSALRPIALVCHALLGVTLAAATLSGGITPARLVGTAALVAPLLATVSGLAKGRREVERWLAVLLVLYAGVASVEVVARGGDTPFLSAGLVAAVLELGTLLALIRRSPSRPRAVRE